MKYFGYIKKNPYICSNKRTDLSFSYLLSKRLFFSKAISHFVSPSLTNNHSFFWHAFRNRLFVRLKGQNITIISITYKK